MLSNALSSQSVAIDELLSSFTQELSKNNDYGSDSTEVDIDELLNNTSGVQSNDWAGMFTELENSTIEPKRKTTHTAVQYQPHPQRQRICSTSRANRVYITQPTVAGESMKTFAQRIGSSLLVLQTYNAQYSFTNTTLPEHTCLMTWEHSNHTASNFEVLSEDCTVLQCAKSCTALLCSHVSHIHTCINNSSRIANDCEFVPTDAQGLTTHLQQNNTITLPTTRTFAELKEEDGALHIQWDVIAQHPEQYPAVFKNTRNDEYTFFFHKFLQNGKCKGIQRDKREEKNHHTYLNSAGLSMNRLSYPKGTVLPTSIPPKRFSISSCEEHIVKLSGTTHYVFASSYDNRNLFTILPISTSTVGTEPETGCIYTEELTTPNTDSVLEVGVWTTMDGWLCYTFYHSLAKIIMKKM